MEPDEREGFDLARCAVDRLKKQLGIHGAVRGKVVKTTGPDRSAPYPEERIDPSFGS